MKSRARKMNRWFLEEVLYLLYYPGMQTGGTIGPYDYPASFMEKMARFCGSLQTTKLHISRLLFSLLSCSEVIHLSTAPITIIFIYILIEIDNIVVVGAVDKWITCCFSLLL
jgi:hypothetical protein